MALRIGLWLMVFLCGSCEWCSGSGAQAQDPPQVSTSQDTVRVLTYNIHHGRGTDDQVDLPRIAAVIKAQQPDLVALQEVDQSTRRTGGVDQTAKLAELTLP